MGREIRGIQWRDMDSTERRSKTTVMSIETGFSCNAYCAFCPQISYRDDANPDVPLDLTTEEIRQRIRYGAENGYKQIGFSGGEATIRPDFIELVALAKELRYELIGLTTNGMMLGYPQYAQKLVKAGVNSVNISVFGHNAKLHDSMMRTPGAFDMAMKAIDNLQALKKRFNLRLDMMSMCIAAPQVLEHFPEHVALMGSKGIKLHMLQPFLMTKGNTHVARYYESSYDKIAWAIREATKVAEQHGGHVKLFNTPVCLFWEIEDKVERQWKKLDVFREHEAKRPGESNIHAQSGYYRVDECATCDEPCNGFRAEYYPQAKMVAEVKASLDEHIAKHGAAELWLAGFELMEVASIREVLQHARARGAGKLVMMTGGIGRAYHEQYSPQVIELIDELCFVPHPTHNDLYDVQDRHASHGNLDDLKKGVATLKQYGLTPRLSATVLADEVRKSPALVTFLGELGIRSVSVVATPNRMDRRPFWERNEFMTPLVALKDSGFEVTLLSGQRPTGAPELAVVDPTPHFVRHRWVSREFDWIGWSVPLWVKESVLLGGDDPRDAEAARGPLPILQ